MPARLGVALAIAGGCSTSTAPPPPVSTEQPPVVRTEPRAVPTLPSAAAPAVLAEAPLETAGTEIWTGMGFQPGAGSASQWSIEMHLSREAPVGARLATIEYRSLGCSGELIRESDREGAMVAIERLHVNPKDTCVDGGTIVLRARGERLDYRWYERGVEGATAMLQRTSPR